MNVAQGEEEEVSASTAASSPAAEDSVPLSTQVYLAARDGLTDRLRSLLDPLDPSEALGLLSVPTEDPVSPPLECQRATPLLVAARHGRDEAVSYLVRRFPGLDLGQTGSVKFGGYSIEGACALWCAAGAGHLKVVEALVGAGADVNQATKFNSTPLRAACFEGHLEVVRFLMDHSASADISNHFNNTCLMIAAYKGHLDVVRFLLERRVDPNLAANCGATAMHFSAEAGHVHVLEELLRHGATMLKSEHGMTPLMAAAERCQSDVVEYMVGRPDVSREDRIDALELLGASLANDKDLYDASSARRYLAWAMRERWSSSEGHQPVRKPESSRRVPPAYGIRRECQTVEEVATELSEDRLHMEGLAVRERLLGADNPELPHPIVFRGAVLADSAMFDRCIALWRHSLRLRREHGEHGAGAGVPMDLLRFAQVFSQILHVGLDLKFDDLYDTMEATGAEIKKNQEAIEEIKAKREKKLQQEEEPPSVASGKPSPPPKTNQETLERDLGINMQTFLYLVVIYTKLKEDLLEEQRFRVMRVLYDVCGVLSPRDPLTGRSLLHLAVDSDTPVDDFHTSDVVRFPSAAAVKALLAAGADPGARCSAAGDTPLHLIVAYQKIVSDFATIHSVISDLVGAGAHTDVVNHAGRTPMQCATTGVAEIILKSQAKMSLKCLAAQSVRRYDITYQGQVPRALETFIELHGP